VICINLRFIKDLIPQLQKRIYTEHIYSSLYYKHLSRHVHFGEAFNISQNILIVMRIRI
jgi:hypothetical protein